MNLIIMEDYKRYSEMLEELIAHIDLKEELKAVVNSNINLARVMCGIDNSKGFTAMQSGKPA